MRDGRGVQDALYAMGQGPALEAYWSLGTTQLDESSRGHDYATIPKEPGLDGRGDHGDFCPATKGITRSGRPCLLALVSTFVGEIV